MKRVIVATVVLVALMTVGTASAGGWAGSRYEKSDCTYTKETDLLYCEATFSSETFVTEEFAIPDAGCPSGTRLVRRTGWRVETFLAWDLYSGRTPVRHRNIAGNEGFPDITWRDFTDVDLGCV